MKLFHIWVDAIWPLSFPIDYDFYSQFNLIYFIPFFSAYFTFNLMLIERIAIRRYESVSRSWRTDTNFSTKYEYESYEFFGQTIWFANIRWRRTYQMHETFSIHWSRMGAAYRISQFIFTTDTYRYRCKYAIPYRVYPISTVRHVELNG